jgi:hypothetical protein
MPGYYDIAGLRELIPMSKTTKIYFLFVLIGLLLFLNLTASADPLGKSDGGPIEEMSENKILIHGDYGSYLLEIIGICSWCEIGVDVNINFERMSRASIQPKLGTKLVRPVKVFVVEQQR